MMFIDNKFDIGDTVYLKTDTEQRERIVACLRINPGNIIYVLAIDERSSEHYDFEISTENNTVLAVI